MNTALDRSSARIAENALFSSVKGLINEYRLTCPKLDVEFVDYINTPGRGEEIKAQYKLSPATDENLLIFDCKANAKVMIVREKELADYDLSGVFAGREPRRTGFKGEQFFTSYIVVVTDPKPFKACFLQGHGEHEAESEDDTAGYFKFARVLQDKNITLEIGRAHV